MKRQYFALSLMAMVLLAPKASADWNPTPGEESLAGAASLGTGVLGSIATPLVFTADISNNQGLGTASVHSAQHLGAALGMSAAGIVFLVDGTGKGLSALTTDSIEAAATLVQATTDTIQDGIQRTSLTLYNSKGQPERKIIPLIVRPGYVELHEKCGG